MYFSLHDQRHDQICHESAPDYLRSSSAALDCCLCWRWEECNNFTQRSLQVFSVSTIHWHHLANAITSKSTNIPVPQECSICEMWKANRYQFYQMIGTKCLKEREAWCITERKNRILTPCNPDRDLELSQKSIRPVSERSLVRIPAGGSVAFSVQ